MKWPVLAFVCLLSISCGARPPRPRVDPDHARNDAARAWMDGDVTRSYEIARAAIEGGARSVELSEIGARAAIASGHSEEAVDWISDRRDEAGHRLLASLYLSLDRWIDASHALADADDPYAAAISEVAMAAADRALYVRRGGPGVLRIQGELPLPVVEVQIDGRSVSALISTGTYTTAISLELRAESGILDAIDLGGMTFENVPYFARDLSDASTALDVPISMVIGADLLMRAGADLDFPNHSITLGTDRAAAVALPLALFDGSFACVRLGFGQRSGWMLFDTGAPFAVAVSPRGIERLELETPARIRLGSIDLEDVPVSTELDDSLEEITSAPIDGVIGWPLIATQRWLLDRRGIQLTEPTG